MDYNNNYGKGNNNQQPVYNNQPQNGYYQNGAYYNNQPQYGNPYAPNQQMGYQQNTQQNNQIDAMSIPQIAEPVNSAFGQKVWKDGNENVQSALRLFGNQK